MAERALTLRAIANAIRWQASQVGLDMVRMHLLYNGGEAKYLRGTVVCQTNGF